MIRQRLSRRPVPLAPLSPLVPLACVLALGGSAAMAAENGLQRYSPGVGGSDMTAPLVPGWYVQIPLVAYHANKIKGNDGQQATNATPTPATATPLGTVPAQPQLRSKIGIDANKMNRDTAGYMQERYDKIANKIKNMFVKVCRVPERPIIAPSQLPISGY